MADNVTNNNKKLFFVKIQGFKNRNDRQTPMEI